MISANFYEALTGMNLNSEGSDVEFSAEWSPVVKNPNGIHGKILLTHDYYLPITTVVDALKDKTKKSTKILGRIKKLESSPDVEERKIGKITVVYLGERNTAKTVTAKLGKADYKRAIEAHGNGRYVELVGELSGQKHAEIKCESFGVIG